MIISSGIYNCDQLDGYIYEEAEEILGLLTYVFHEDAFEVISLDSVKEGKGIGSKLMQEVELLAKQKGMLKITLLTTNDNLNALKFLSKKRLSHRKSHSRCCSESAGDKAFYSVDRV